MDNGYVLLTEKEEMWAKMLIEVLNDNGVPCVSRSVLGVGFVIKTGTPERLKIYVPSEQAEHANELLRELFDANSEE